MMKNAGAQISDGQLDTLAAYLAENFPERPKAQGEIVSGPAHVSFKEWTTPTPGSRPHDPLATLDGTIWYTGQMANLLGHIDPTTGRIDQYRLNTPMSGPHGLVADEMGDIWFTANFAGYIGKLDPGSGRIVEYRLPDPNARDPHTPLFDQNGILWFTVLDANMVGRLDPKTGQIRLATSPTPRSDPYGLAIDSKGVPFFCEFGANKLASVDPRTMAIHEYLLPPIAGRGGSPSRRTTSSGTPTTRAAILVVSIPIPARSGNTPRPAGRARNPTASHSRRELCGTASPACGPIRWSGSIPPARRFRAGSFPRAAGLCAT